MSYLKFPLIAALNYLRWTQMLPMILTWGMFLLGIVMILFVNFQEQGLMFLIWLQETSAGIPGLHDLLATAVDKAGVRNESGGFTVGDEQLRPLFIGGWMLLSLLYGALEYAFNRLRGKAATPVPLSRKLWRCTFVCLLLLGICVLGFHFGGAGSAADRDINTYLYMLMVTTIIWLVSFYSLAVTHWLTGVTRTIDQTWLIDESSHY